MNTFIYVLFRYLLINIYKECSQSHTRELQTLIKASLSDATNPRAPIKTNWKNNRRFGHLLKSE